MRFAHMADCHIGGWRDPRLKDLSVKAFEEAIHKILDLNVDFILIAGDLFHTSIPSFDTLKATVKQLKILTGRMQNFNHGCVFEYFHQW